MNIYISSFPGGSDSRESGGYSPWGLKRVGHNLATKTTTVVVAKSPSVLYILIIVESKVMGVAGSTMLSSLLSYV